MFPKGFGIGTFSLSNDGLGCPLWSKYGTQALYFQKAVDKDSFLILMTG